MHYAWQNGLTEAWHGVFSGWDAGSRDAQFGSAGLPAASRPISMATLPGLASENNLALYENLLFVNGGKVGVREAMQGHEGEE